MRLSSTLMFAAITHDLWRGCCDASGWTSLSSLREEAARSRGGRSARRLYSLFAAASLTASTDDGGVLFGGSFYDYKHPGCERSITIIDDDYGEVVGADSSATSAVCDGKTDVPWGPLVAKLETIDDINTIMIDFSEKGGPSNLIGVWDSALPGIDWADGNKWTFLDGGEGPMPTSTLRNTESSGSTSKSSSAATSSDDAETNTWGFYMRRVRIEVIVMLLFSLAIFGSVVYVAYRRWSSSRYSYQALSRYDPDYYDRGGGRTSWLVNPHQMSPSMHGSVGVENEFGKGRIEYGSGAGEADSWTPLASSQPDVELLVL